MRISDWSSDVCSSDLARTSALAKARQRAELYAKAAGLRVKRIISISERSEEHTSELQSLMRISYAVFCLKKKKNQHTNYTKDAQLVRKIMNYQQHNVKDILISKYSV